MRVAILGAGAMGIVLGAYLNKNYGEVELINSNLAHVKALNEKGAHVIGTVEMTIPVKAVTTEEMSGCYDIVFLFTKQTANKMVLPNLIKYIGPDSTVCTLQNGVPEPYVAKIIGKNRTIGGTVLWSATFIEPGVSELTKDIDKSHHLFEIGEIDGSITNRIQSVAKVLECMGHVHISTNLIDSRWGKLVNNACMSGLSAICGYTFGEVIDNDMACAFLSYIGYEVKQVCEASGHTLPVLLGQNNPELLEIKNQGEFNSSQQMFKSMYNGLRSAKASMLQDLEKGKITEVSMINGFVCETGAKYGISTPFNDKIVEIVRKIEKKELKCSIDNLKYFDQSLVKYELYKFKNN